MILMISVELMSIDDRDSNLNKVIPTDIAAMERHKTIS